ncbi:hypothetical protein UZ36_05705 [Candidatus Nitromaritima sp. SCGC AAA799-C22]|nr:hypothetical protein UZ36_05705 [Candidatus Nitromaritima sp. SCGC AAA799-C22]
MSQDIRVLFIDDDPEDIRGFRRILSMGECDDFLVDFAGSGEEGLNLYKEKMHEVVLTDYRLGSLNALNIVESLKKISEFPVVIVITGQGDEETAVQLLKMGVSDYLVKDNVGMYLKLIPRVIRNSLKERSLIKEKQQALEALKKSQERYQRLEKNLPDNFVYSRGTDGVFTYISPSITMVLGYSPEEFKTHYSEYLTDNPINKEVERLTNLSLQGKQQKPYKLEAYHKGGSKHWLLISEIPVFNDEDKVIAIEGIARDITKWETMQSELLKKEKIYRSIVEKVPDLIFQLDPDQKISFINSAFKFLGYESDELIGNPVESIIASDKIDEILPQLATKSVGPLVTMDLEVPLKVNQESMIADQLESITYTFYATGLWSISDEDVFKNNKDGIFWGTLCIGKKL